MLPTPVYVFRAMLWLIKLWCSLNCCLLLEEKSFLEAKEFNSLLWMIQCDRCMQKRIVSHDESHDSIDIKFNQYHKTRPKNHALSIYYEILSSHIQNTVTNFTVNSGERACLCGKSIMHLKIQFQQLTSIVEKILLRIIFCSPGICPIFFVCKLVR